MKSSSRSTALALLLAMLLTTVYIGCNNNQNPLSSTGAESLEYPGLDSLMTEDLRQGSIPIALASPATPIQISDVVVSTGVSTTSDGVGPTEWIRLQADPKVQQLIRLSQAKINLASVAKPNHGLVTTVNVSYTRAGITTTMPVRITIIPISGMSSNGGTAALIIGRYMQTEMIVPRLLVRTDPNNWTVTEYAFRLDGRLTQMTARFGDCVFRSALKILEQKVPQAHAALRQRLNNTAHFGTSLGDGLKGVYDARINGVGVSEMVLSTAVSVAGNLEEEYSGVYLSGAINRGFKVEVADPTWLKLSKELAKHIFFKMATGAAGSLWSWVISFLGFGGM